MSHYTIFVILLNTEGMGYLIHFAAESIYRMRGLNVKRCFSIHSTVMTTKYSAHFVIVTVRLTCGHAQSYVKRVKQTYSDTSLSGSTSAA